MTNDRLARSSPQRTPRTQRRAEEFQRFSSLRFPCVLCVLRGEGTARFSLRPTCVLDARTMPTPLSTLRMLDLSRQLPGPFCSTLLADLGMDVLVVTSPTDPFGLGIPFMARNKRSMTLNLKQAAGREIFFRLVADADVLLEGFRPGVTQRLRVDYETLSTHNPR